MSCVYGLYIRADFFHEVRWYTAQNMNFSINPLSASVAQSIAPIDLLCNSVDWFLYGGNTGT